MQLVDSASLAAAASGQRIRVMIVDDAIVVRGLFSRWIASESDMEVVASLRTGREAVSQLERADPDVVVLDIDMPDLDGISALPLLLAKKRDLIIIMASTLTRRNAEISLRALSLGATDYIPKPSSNRDVSGSPEFHFDLIEKIRQLGLRARSRRHVQAPPLVPNSQPFATPVAPAPRVPLAATTSASRQLIPVKPIHTLHGEAHAPIVLRAMPITPPRVLLIGASTGGPQALNAILSQIGALIDRAPVLITQHMPPTFTTILAEHLGRSANRPTREATDGEPVNAGTVYLAPGGKHMTVARRNGAAVIALDNGPMINFCKPAVDPLFSSAAEVWGPKALALVLTGMGSDGLFGAQALVAAGGHVLAQDEATSVVWGMPGKVAQNGLCSAVLPLDHIAPRLTRIFAGERP
ncbi:MAG: chemotaxis response regulator protein-glutamate methylesterase [Pseudolabrys sp.]|nr:chemotaxis response regulator protein-glutamate methylesterase [Pseudolabrys sp.]